MTVLGWVAVLVAAWCVASVVAATGFGVVVRRRRERRHADLAPTTRPRDALDPLDTGPMRLWLAELPETSEPLRPTRAPSGP